MNQEFTLTGAAYIRVSTEDQLEFSPDSQLSRIKEYAQTHRILIPETYIFLDEGISGRHADNRPAFMQMIRTARKKPKPFDVILVWKFSRFARNRQDSIFYKSMLRKECGIDVISITEQLSGDPTSILVEALLEAMDEYYSINLSQEVRRGMNEKFLRGGVVCPPPFGYRMGKARYEVSPENAPYVQDIFSDFLKGMTFRQIAQKLNLAGVSTARGNAFEPRTIKYILGNPVYAGMQRRRLHASVPKSSLSVVPALHEPLITKETFQKTQERLRMMQKIHVNNTAAPASFMLQGLVRCSSCHSVLTWSKKGHSLQCCKYTRGQCFRSHSISIQKLNTAVLKKLSADLTLPGLLKWLQRHEVSENEKNTMLRSFISEIIFSRKECTFCIQYYI